MADIKAFVAHSFSENDKAMIQTFIDHFESLAGTLPGFSWDHAQEAEPTSVSGKVLAKIEDKNVFIGICSKTEYVAAPERMLPLLLFAQLRIKKSDVLWKTSDWIIQEIGLAVGRGMKVIIFLEEGVRTPGGLFSDVEYIQFRRDNPQASFDKLLQMLGTFMPKSISTASTVEAKPAASDKPEEEEQAEKRDDLEPGLDWDENRYNRAAFRTLVIRKDADALAKIDTAFRTSPLSKGNARSTWEATLEWYRLVAGQNADFGKIKNAVDADPTNTRLLSYLAVGYADFGEHALSAQAYERAAECAASEKDKDRFLIQAATAYQTAGEKRLSDAIIEKLKLATANNLERSQDVLSYLKNRTGVEKDELFQLAVLEEIAVLNPTNTKARFELAYQHSQVGNSDMALYHYEKIPSFARDASAWNNLGVAYGEFEMPIKSMDAFRRAAEANESLAMSNLGNSFLNAGFISEAQKEADKAFAIEDHHENVPELLKRLKEAPKEEDKKHKETLEKVKEKEEFYRKAAGGVLKATPTTLATKWNYPDGNLEAKMEGSSIRLFGEYRRPSFGGLSPSPLSNVMTTHKIEYTGQVRGHIITGEVKRTDDSGPVRSLLAMGGGSETKFVMVLSEDQAQLLVAESPDGPRPTFYTLTRVDAKN